jgi:hypothetical protein
MMEDLMIAKNEVFSDVVLYVFQVVYRRRDDITNKATSFDPGAFFGLPKHFWPGPRDQGCPPKIKTVGHLGVLKSWRDIDSGIM